MQQADRALTSLSCCHFYRGCEEAFDVAGLLVIGNSHDPAIFIDPASFSEKRAGDVDLGKRVSDIEEAVLAEATVKKGTHNFPVVIDPEGTTAAAAPTLAYRCFLPECLRDVLSLEDSRRHETDYFRFADHPPNSGIAGINDYF
jgi:hypothetical protein